MLALFTFGNNPLNQQIATWTPETLPADWREVRDAWDRFHAMSSVLAALAFTVLLVDILRQMPSSWQVKHARRAHRGKRSEGELQLLRVLTTAGR